jgi:hypothetical protein
MKKLLLLILGALPAAAAMAVAQPASAPEPMLLTFHATSMEGITNPERSVKPYRLFDHMVISVSDPVACGQVPSGASATIKGGKLIIRYALSPARTDAQGCTLVSQFDVQAVPRRDLEIDFASGSGRTAVATLTPCPFYHPSAGAAWECLAPQKR